MKRREFMDCRNDVARCVLKIGLQVASSDDALAGVKVDQYQRPTL